MNDPAAPKVKLSNQEQFEKYLQEYPPEYQIGQKVKTSFGFAKITGRVFKEREKIWKYTIAVIALPDTHFDDVIIYSAV